MSQPVLGSGTPGPLLAAVEVALNRYLALDADALAALAELEGRTLALQLQPPDWWLVFDFMGKTVRVDGHLEGRAEAVVSGSPTVFLQLFGEQLQSGGLALPRGLRVEGDPELLQRFRDLLTSVGFDLAEILEPYLGDIMAQRVAEAAGGFLRWARESVQALGQQTSDYLRFETRDLVHRDEVEDFVDGVDTLRDRLARAEARIARLERKRS